MGEADERVTMLRDLGRRFMEHVPHNRSLGVEVLELLEGEAVFRLPYAAQLVGNPETGVLHGGAITSMMDACCGAAVFMKMAEPTSMATLDLRIDYLRQATPPRDVLARAVCYRITKNVAFVRCLAFHAAEDGSTPPRDREVDPIAAAAGTFMLSTPVTRRKKEPGA